VRSSQKTANQTLQRPFLRICPWLFL